MSGNDNRATKVKVPEGNDNVLQKAAAPIATLSSHSDPWPDYLMSLACGAASAYSYSSLGNPRQAAIKAAFAGVYYYAGRLLITGNPTLGYDLGTVASIALTGMTAPQAMAAGGTYHVAMASLGGISSVANLIKSYEMRTGKPEEVGFEKERR